MVTEPVIHAFIQARTGSTRLPGKINMELGGLACWKRVWNAAKKIKYVSGVYLLMPEDYDCGENDVLRRYRLAADRFRPDVIIRLTGDCPVLDSHVCDLVVAKYLEGGCDYASNVFPVRTFPDGMDCEVFAAEAIRIADNSCKNPVWREHVTTYLQKYFRFKNVKLPIDWSHIRLTLDTKEDLEWLKTGIEYHESFWREQGKSSREEPKP